MQQVGGTRYQVSHAQAMCLSLPVTQHSLPLGLAACTDTPELMPKSQSHKHDYPLCQHPGLAVHVWLHLARDTPGFAPSL